jgi:hypothetical protein
MQSHHRSARLPPSLPPPPLLRMRGRRPRQRAAAQSLGAAAGPRLVPMSAVAAQRSDRGAALRRGVRAGRAALAACAVHRARLRRRAAVAQARGVRAPAHAARRANPSVRVSSSDCGEATPHRRGVHATSTSLRGAAAAKRVSVALVSSIAIGCSSCTASSGIRAAVVPPTGAAASATATA